MKALVKKEAAPGLWLMDVPIPTINDDEVLVKVRKSTICGTDLHIYKWDAWAQKTISTPLVIGHEFMGEIVKTGNRVKKFKIGDRVCAEGHIVCGICTNCCKGKKHLCSKPKGLGVQRPGSFAEYVSLPVENVFALPDSISDDLATIFDPYGNAVHTALSFPLTAENVLITGAGPIGIMAAAIAKFAGAHNVVISDRNPYRLDLAQKMGATHTVDVTKRSVADAAKELGITDGFTVGLEMAGSPQALSTLLEQMQPGGKVALLGILPPNTIIDWDLVIFKMLELKGIYGREIFGTWHQMVRLLEAGLNLAPIITHQLPIDRFEEAFEIMLSGNSGKLILNWM